jgi:ABC-2 type transport system permease protein
MHKLLSAVRKEFLILISDIPGLVILFIMPVMLILIVIVAQENAVKASREAKTSVLVVDNARSESSEAILQSLDSSGFYRLIREYRKKPVDENTAAKLVSDGDFPIGIVLAEKDSTIRLIVDPGIQEPYKSTLTGSMTYLIKAAQGKVTIQKLFRALNPEMAGAMNNMVATTMAKLPPVQETYAKKDLSVIRPTMSQNSIPGFILFAMFFIVIPLSGSIINEKSQGSFYRLRTLPTPVLTILSSKVIIYLGVCILQFILMVATGIWLLPAIFEMPAFQLGNQCLAILIATLTAGLGAIGFGLIVGTSSTTHGQSALFGSVMVVIMGIISGTFLPVHMFPKVIQYISYISPMRWGIDNYLDIFIRGGTLTTLVPNILLLLLFFVFAMIISIAIFAKQK